MNKVAEPCISYQSPQAALVEINPEGVLCGSSGLEDTSLESLRNAYGDWD